MASAGKKAQSEERKARLAAALRENLKRRKAQSRAKAETGPDGAPKAADGRRDQAAKTGQ